MGYNGSLALFVLLQLSATCLAMRIVGGVLNSINTVPWTASLQRKGEHICGATIINENTLLTAAHCLKGISPSALLVRVGSNLHETGGVTRSVNATKVHPKYTEMSMAYDVGLVFLSSPLKFSPSIQAIELANSNDMFRADTGAKICGWGTLTEDGDVSNKLRCADIKVIKMAKCKNIYGTQLKPSMFCAGLLSGAKDACQGDSGGGLVINDKVAGIVSWGIGCAMRNFPGVYTSVARVNAWITDNLVSGN